MQTRWGLCALCNGFGCSARADLKGTKVWYGQWLNAWKRQQGDGFARVCEYWEGFVPVQETESGCLEKVLECARDSGSFSGCFYKSGPERWDGRYKSKSISRLENGHPIRCAFHALPCSLLVEMFKMQQHLPLWLWKWKVISRQLCHALFKVCVCVVCVCVRDIKKVFDVYFTILPVVCWSSSFVQ